MTKNRLDLHLKGSSGPSELVQMSSIKTNERYFHPTLTMIKGPAHRGLERMI